MSVDYILEKGFKGVVFIIVCEALGSAHSTKCCREASRVSVEVRERRSAILLKFGFALMF